MLDTVRPNDLAHLGRLRDYYARYGALPSYAGLSAVVGFRAKTSAVKLAERLRNAGVLQSAPGGKLAPTPEFFSLPLVTGNVRAGHPEHQHAEDAADFVSLDRLMIDNPSSTVMITVRGDSMCEAGILDGDIALVERGAEAKHGDFVIAVVDGEFTLKELFLRGGQVKLIPKNAAFEPIAPLQRLEIFGVVRGIVRKYQPAKSARKR